jgi:hypothetical protein
MARYVIDAPTLLHLVDAGIHVDPGHQLVAPNSIRSEALELLLRDVRAGKRDEGAALEAHERMTGIKMRVLGDRVSRRTAWPEINPTRVLFVILHPRSAGGSERGYRVILAEPLGPLDSTAPGQLIRVLRTQTARFGSDADAR